MFRLVLFDIDGTLALTNDAGVKAFAKVFETQFNAVDGFEKLKFHGRTDISTIREFFSYHNIPDTTENIRRFHDHYLVWLERFLNESNLQPLPGVQDFIRDLQGSSRPPMLGLLTGNFRGGAERKLRRVGLWETFVTGAFADDHEDRDKVAAVARARGNQLLGGDLRDHEVLVIGDTPLDIRCARAIGAKVLAVATGASTVEELKRHEPDWAVANLSEMSPTPTRDNPFLAAAGQGT